MSFEIDSSFSPQGDQGQAIANLARSISAGNRHQTLLGVTGSGKTFTVANVIRDIGRPTLIMSHNKTLAAQLYSEFKQFFPREPSEENPVSWCGQFRARGAIFMVAGGFSIRAVGYGRHTSDIDFLIVTSLENEGRVFQALATLPDGCARELEPGEVGKYSVLRVADEILANLRAKASGIDYPEASQCAFSSASLHEFLDGKPVASPKPNTYACTVKYGN